MLPFRVAASLMALSLLSLALGQTRSVSIAATAEQSSQQTVDDKIKQLIWIKEFGAKCDGITDDTAAIQNAWNAASAAAKSVWLGGVGTGTCKFSSLAAPAPSRGETGNRSPLIGDGIGSTVLVSTAKGLDCAIKISLNYGKNGDYNATFRGFTLRQSKPLDGAGICLAGVTSASFEDIWIENFTYGVYAIDSINIVWSRCAWRANTVGLLGVYGTHTNPNAWTFIAPKFFFNTAHGIKLSNPADINIYGGDYENNGQGNSRAAVIYIHGNPQFGTKGLNISGGYFSANNGIADILFDTNSAPQSGVHSVTGVEFQRAASNGYVQNHIYLINSGSGKTVLNISGNGFQSYSPYKADAARPYINVKASSLDNYVLSTHGNFYGSSVEEPSGPWYWETSWATVSSTLGCGSGSLSGANTATLRYKFTSLKSVALNVSMTFSRSAAGTCANYVTLALPYASASDATIFGRDSYNNTVWLCMIAASSNTARCVNTSGTLPVLNNATAVLSGTYERK
jgi:hypothetical protein